MKNPIYFPSILTTEFWSSWAWFEGPCFACQISISWLPLPGRNTAWYKIFKAKNLRPKGSQLTMTFSVSKSETQLSFCFAGVLGHVLVYGTKKTGSDSVYLDSVATDPAAGSVQSLGLTEGPWRRGRVWLRAASWAALGRGRVTGSTRWQGHLSP